MAILNFARVCDSVTLIYILYIIVIMLTNKTCGPVGEACIAMSGRTWVRSQVPSIFFVLFLLYKSYASPSQASTMSHQHPAMGFIINPIQRPPARDYGTPSGGSTIGWRLTGLQLGGPEQFHNTPPWFLQQAGPSFFSFISFFF